MKKLYVISMVLGAGFFLATAANAAISGTAHDFSEASWNTSGEICVTCHTPHNADTTVAATPLWNHEVSAVITYTLYTSDTLNATLNQPDGVSKLCLACHDGTVALDSFGGATGSTNIGGGSLGLGAIIGGGESLAGHHPVSFIYNDALATTDGELYEPTTNNSGLGGTIDMDMLFGTKLECSSCHDVHGRGNPSLLLIDNAASALCLTCHNK